MARLKRIVKSALEDRSPRFLLATIALGVVISLIAGIAIGYKVEQSRAKPAKRVATTDHQARKTTTARHDRRSRPRPTSPAPSSRRSSKNVAASSSTATRSRCTSRSAPKTRVAVAKPAKASSIVVGSRVLFQPSSASPTTATEVVVLPGRGAASASR